ncbi:hypothetical protein TNCV_4527961 [Trichonephila clavipes]|nr:hypothetical protein TNCV_4527961 [Trichonephila clavipes]
MSSSSACQEIWVPSQMSSTSLDRGTELQDPSLVSFTLLQSASVIRKQRVPEGYRQRTSPLLSQQESPAVDSVRFTDNSGSESNPGHRPNYYKSGFRRLISAFSDCGRG